MSLYPGSATDDASEGHASSASPELAGAVFNNNVTKQNQHSKARSTSINAPVPSNSSSKKMFTKDIATMMYGFGDALNPNVETVECVEDLVVQYIINLTQKAMEVNKTSRITVDDILFVARNDAKKYSRVKELLYMNEKLKRMRKAFEDDKLVELQ